MAAINKLTETAVRQAKPKEKGWKLADGGGLYLEVTPSGARYWRLKYRYAGKEKRLALGVYPAVTLAMAREKTREAKSLLARNIDPGEQRREAKSAMREAHANTFEAVALEWLARQTDKADVTRAKSRWLLQFAIDAFGHRPIAEIKPPMVLAVCREREDAGKHETAQRIKVKCGQVFRYAIGKGLIESDPTRDLTGQLITPTVQHRAAIVNPAGVGKLLRDIDAYNGRLETCCALKLAPLVFIRPGELRSARWQDIDLDAALWSFTPPKTRKQTGVDHLIPLSRQALEILRQLQAVNGKGEFVFRSSGKEGYLSENAVLAALRRMGYGKGEMTGHGFRAIARTLLAERLRYAPELIEQQLAHRVADVHGRAYNRTAFIEERTAMMQAWADYLDDLKTKAY